MRNATLPSVRPWLLVGICLLPFCVAWTRGADRSGPTTDRLQDLSKAVKASEDPWSGVWWSEGGSGSKSYHSVVTIAGVGDGYLVQETIVNGDTTIGVGVSTGDGHLSVGWAQGKVTGVTVYALGKDDPKRLDVKWFTFGNGLNRAKLTLLRRLPKAAAD